MKLTNTSSNKTIASKIKFCNSFLSKAKGLMFSKPIKDECIIMLFIKETNVTIHMLFVFFPIDIIFLDKQKKIIQTKENARPFTTIVRSKNKVSYVVELPAFTISRTKTRVGDKLSF
jgi:uncharacterized protein